ncbi:MAG: cobalt-zinc-cadmium efflux system protein [Myxococcota bacterium]|jgi:cobalt-zinc-cadmium efflux system protein
MGDFDAHPHHHGSAVGAATRRALWVALFLNGGFLFVEAGVGWYSGSLALLGDAAHMVSDVLSIAVALGAARLALRPPDPNQTFGLRRAEVLGAFLNGLLLWAASAWIVWEAGQRMVAGPPPIEGFPVLVVATLGLAVNLGSAWYLWRAGSDDMNAKGALWHMLADAAGSVGAIIAAGFMLAGFYLADPLISVFIAALVVWAGWGLLAESTRVLLQLPPPGFNTRDAIASLRSLPGVVNVHDLHVWTLDGSTSIVTAHIVGEPGADLNALCLAGTDILSTDYGVDHVTLQVERDTLPLNEESPPAVRRALK